MLNSKRVRYFDNVQKVIYIFERLVLRAELETIEHDFAENTETRKQK